MFLLTWLIPSVVYTLFATASMGPGTAICAIAWILIGAIGSRTPFRWSRRLWRIVAIALLVMPLLFIHGVVIDLWFGGVDFPRLLLSGVILLLMLFGAYAVADRLLTASPERVAATARIAFLVLTIMGFGSIAGLPSIGASTFAKPVIVFSEPSIFAFAYLPVFIFTVAIAARRRQIVLLALGFILAMGLQSLTLLAGVLGASCLVLRKTQLILVLGALAAIVGFLALDLSYYAGRLALSGDSHNLSTLVFLQGWQRAGLNLTETQGLGIGFQQFGFVGSLGDVAARIIELTGASVNLYDGGSTGSKLIAELGAVGIVLIGLYVRLAVRGFRLIRRAQNVPSEKRDKRQIFVYSLILAYTSELFLRGTGYLAPSGFLVMAALMAVAQLSASTHRASEPGLDPMSGRSASGNAGMATQ